LFRALIGGVPYGGVIEWTPGARLGYMPQRIDLDPHLSLTLKDFLMTKIKILNLPSAVLLKTLKSVELEEKQLARRLNKLSASQLQRALIAFALIGEPNVLLFDEPTAGVDIPREEHIYHLLHKLQHTFLV
jgi:zinc transport system ATP-binding protein